MSRRAEQKARSHTKIVDAASAQLRAKGVSGMGVAEVMAAAGLTHGGFYSHFADKDALIAEAFEAAARHREDWFGGMPEERRSEHVPALLNRYLDREHRDAPEQGCPYAVLGQEVALGKQAHRLLFGDELAESAKQLAGRVPDGIDQPAADRALALLSLCAGALMLSRAVEGGALSDRILRAAQQFGMEAEDGVRAQRDKSEKKRGKKDKKKKGKK